TPNTPTNFQPEEKPAELSIPPEMIAAQTLPPEETEEAEAIAASQTELHKRQFKEAITTQENYTKSPQELESSPPNISKVKSDTNKTSNAKNLEQTEPSIKTIIPEEKKYPLIIEKPAEGPKEEN